MNVKIMELKHTILDKNTEISRLKVEMEEAHTELAISIKERIDLGNQLAEASKAATDMEDALHEATSEFTKQLAEARAELVRYKAGIVAIGKLSTYPSRSKIVFEGNDKIAELRGIDSQRVRVLIMKLEGEV